MSKIDDIYAAVEPEARAWLVRLRSGDATPEEGQAFRRWCAERPEHARVVAMMGVTWDAVGSLAARLAAQDAAAGQLWTGNTVHPLRPGRRAFVGFAVAAGASWLALRPPLQLWPALNDYAADYRTGTGEQRQVALSDRVKVEMNTQTRINMLPVQVAQSGQAAQHGIDLLDGEAEIVAATPSSQRTDPIRPVVVVAGRGRLQAQIARFNVRRAGDQVCVTCVSGSVAFAHPRRQLTLSAGQQLAYSDRDVRPVSSVDPATVTAWRRGLLVFDDVPLAQAVDEINRYRPGKLILRNAKLGQRRVQANLSIADIDRAVEMIHQVYGARVTELPGNIVLLG
jgi:transmembrane sensor